MISIIVPVYNERNTIEEIVNKVKVLKMPKEIIIVDDGSTDGTGQILKEMKDRGLRIIFHEKNHGKGRAVRTGIEAATGDIIIIQDADLEYDPNDYPALIEPIASGQAAVVYGSRWLGQKLDDLPFNLFRLGRWSVTLLTNMLYGTKITDEPCCYKVFKAEVIKSIPLDCEGFEFCPEITAKLSRRGHKIYEVAVSYSPRDFKAGKKITYSDGLKAILTLLKYRFWR